MLDAQTITRLWLSEWKIRLTATSGALRRYRPGSDCRHKRSGRPRISVILRNGTTRMASFQAVDVNNNGKLEPAEFQAAMATAYGMSGASALAAMKKWDVDQSESIGPYEYVTLSCTQHAEKYFGGYKLANQQKMAESNAMFPCGLCCLACCSYFAICCSICTLCLSWIPMCCMTSNAASRMGDPAVAAELCETKARLRREMGEEIKQNCIEKLLKGPDAQTKTSIQTAQQVG